MLPLLTSNPIARIGAHPRLLALALMALAAATSAMAQPAASSSYYVEAGSYGTQRESDPPAYVRNIGSTYANSLTWLDAGAEYRLRYEYRDDDVRRLVPNDTDQPLLQRTRLYAGIRNIIDPLRFTFELTDSREYNSHFTPDNRDVNQLELIQANAELYFNDVLTRDARGNNRALRIRAGRMAFETLDRRLVARNEWRNTTNNFDGVRVNLGDDNNDWALEAWSLNPVTRIVDHTDKANQDIRFNGVVAHLRAWSSLVTLEPHYFQLHQDATAATGFVARNMLAPGLRVYGRWLNGAITYDASMMQQHGNDGGKRVQAEARTLEVGYSWLSHAWKPRLSVFYGSASGDRNPNDNSSERFERFFGFGRAWSADDYFVFENLRAPKLKLEFQPVKGIRIDAGYNWYRLASNTDRFTNLLAGNAGNRDRSGLSGSDLGESWDVRVRFTLAPHVQANVGYSSFRLGEFTRKRQLASTGHSVDDSDFFYVELTWRLFE